MPPTETPTPDATSRNPNPIDIHVGARTRLRRKMMGLSQDTLAKALGLTFQQVQKYERGTNRISASKLYETARVLRVPLSYFFEGLNDPTEGGEGDAGADTSAITAFMHSPEGLELAAVFPRIRPPAARRRILQLASALAGDDASDDASD